MQIEFRNKRKTVFFSVRGVQELRTEAAKRKKCESEIPHIVLEPKLVHI